MNTGSPPCTTTRGQGGGSLPPGRGAQHGHNWHYSSARHPTPPSTPCQKFDGAMAELKGHVFHLIGVKSANLFIKTKKELTEALRC